MARRPRRKRRGSERLLTLGLVALALLVGAFVSSLVYRWAGPPSPRGREAPAGAGQDSAAPARGAGETNPASAAGRGHIRVEVLNAARVPGLADRMTELLRAQGFDVVSYDNASSLSDSTRILDRVGNARYAREVALALPGTAIRRQLSRERFVDVTVVVGRDYERFFADGPDTLDGSPRQRGVWERIRSALGA